VTKPPAGAAQGTTTGRAVAIGKFSYANPGRATVHKVEFDRDTKLENDKSQKPKTGLERVDTWVESLARELTYRVVPWLGLTFR
jgi:hypothetical protein